MIRLGRADMALFSDPIPTRVQIPSLMAMPRTRAQAGTLVQFAGDTYPTPFSGTSRSGTFDLTCRFSPKTRTAQVALVHLIDEVARVAPDRRLLLRTHIDPAADLPHELQVFVERDAMVAVVVFALTETPNGTLGKDINFTASIVEHTFEV